MWEVLWFSFFLFKQKTAYEMRISDWSSDVCSSDLPRRLADPDPVGIEVEEGQEQLDRRAVGEIEQHGDRRQEDEDEQQRRRPALHPRRHPGRGHDRHDRKSVVKGKSVSVRVALGGRRIFKNKTHNQTTRLL